MIFLPILFFLSLFFNSTSSFFFFYSYYFLSLFLVVPGLCCARGLSLAAVSRGCPLVVVRGRLIVVVSLAVERRRQVRSLLWSQHGLSCCSSQSLDLRSVVVARSCFVACGIFLDQGSNLCPLHWQVDSSVPPGKSPAFFSVLSRTSSTMLNSSGRVETLPFS